jgi:cysteine-rich repeat protein
MIRLIQMLVLLSCGLASVHAMAARPYCGDGVCKGGETALACPEDCSGPVDACGDSVCGPTESCASCATDCGACPPADACNNDGVCNLGEDCLGCASDCPGVVSGKKSDRYCCGGSTEASLFCGTQCGSDCGTPLPTGPICGNGNVEFPEECDDGNTADGDGCSSTCIIEYVPVCGNGILDDGEQCDDGNTVAGDGCSATCQTEATSALAPANQFNIGDSIGEAEAADGTIGSLNHESVWSTGYDVSDTINSLNERYEISDPNGYYENTPNRDPAFNKAISGSVMADFTAQAQQIVSATDTTPTGNAGRISVLLGNNDVCADTVQSMTDIAQFESQFRAGLDVLAASGATQQASVAVSSLPAIYWLWESRATDSVLSWCRLLAWPNVPCQNLLSDSGDDCASAASREDPDTIYQNDGPNCQRRKQFHARIRDEYNVVLRDVVEEYAANQQLPNIEYVDIFDVRFGKSHVNGGDCFHPSLEGHRILADEQFCRSSSGEGDATCAQQ